MRVDVAIAGGGPAGLAVAIHSAMRGLSTVVLERRAAPPDKACGEGLMPSGVRQLEELGARKFIGASDCTPLEGIRYVQEDGTLLEGRLPEAGGLGIRRVALVSALAERAREVGATVRSRCPVLGYCRTARSMQIETPVDQIEAGILVAADGLSSPMRRAEGLEGCSSGPRRFGLRQHFSVEPWSHFVEVHLSPGAEAYVTPAGSGRVGVAFLWEDGRLEGRITARSLQARFPQLGKLLVDAPIEARARGAGPLAHTATAWTRDRFVLVGDAAGYVDAITGEGLSLSFAGAAALGAILPDALKQGATQRSLAPYEREFGKHFRKYAYVTRAVLGLARYPAVRRRVVRNLSYHPMMFERLLAWFASG